MAAPGARSQGCPKASEALAQAREIPNLESFRLRHGDQLHHWSVAVLLPPREQEVGFAHLILRPDGLLIHHVTPGVSLAHPAVAALGPELRDPVRAILGALPPPGAIHGTEPNLTLHVGGLAPPPPLHAGSLFRQMDHYPARRLARSPSHASEPSMTLGFPVRFHFSPSTWRGQVVRENTDWPPDGDPLLVGHVSIPDRLAPLSTGSMLRHQPYPDPEFLDALGATAQALRCDGGTPAIRKLDFSTLQAIAALGAGILPPPRGHALIGVWPVRPALAHLPGTTLVLSLSLVGASLPARTGFVRATLPSGWILFQRRSPALHPFVVHDIRHFAQLCTGHRGPIAFITGSSMLPMHVRGSPFSSCSLYDIPASDASPYVPPVTEERARSPERID